MSLWEVAPLTFTVGVLVGLLASSGWRVIRRRDYDRWSARHDDPET